MHVLPMKTLQFTISINAPAAKVWHALWDLENYKVWTKTFIEGSYYKTDSFTEGSKIHLLTPKGDGMYSILDKVLPNECLAFRHIGSLKNFEELPLDSETEQWTNAMETYTLKGNGNSTQVTVNVDTFESYIDFMNKTFPVALNELKRIAES
jgi:uncharacterized protein YndB with AHSA1/START domain